MTAPSGRRPALALLAAMARAPEPAVAPEDIVFELEQFERSEGRLKLTGRWFGVRGRRFVRPTLTLGVDGGRVRSLADLDDKPWPAEDGQPWQASFPWENDGQVEATELSVAPDIAIQLPAPSSRRTRSQRLSAVPRREAMTASWGEWPAPLGEGTPAATEEELPGAIEVAVAEPEPGEIPSVATEPDPDPEPTREEMESLMLQLAEATAAAAASSAELETLRAELDAMRAELEEARRELSDRADASEAIASELAATRAAREAALRSAARAEAERESALTRAVQAEAERESLAADSARIAADLERAGSELDRLVRERDQAVATRGAALVMRGATQALPAYEQHVGWVRRGLALLLLIGVIFAALIVLHVL